MKNDCESISDEIRRYRLLLQSTSDPAAVRALNDLIKDAVARLGQRDKPQKSA
jgi:hypothetical protein